jgi:uncharacterized protein (DUF433 family)
LTGRQEAITFRAMRIAGHPRIDVDPGICGGKPVIAGTRVRVTDILEMLAGGVASAEIVADYPYLAAEDIQAALAYGAALTSHPVVLAAE